MCFHQLLVNLLALIINNTRHVFDGLGWFDLLSSLVSNELQLVLVDKHKIAREGESAFRKKTLDMIHPNKVVEEASQF